MAITRADQTVASCIVVARRWLRDRDSDNYRWTDAEILQEIAAMFTQLQNEARRGDSSGLLKPAADFTYTAGSDSMELPSEVGGCQIAWVENYDNTSRPYPIDHVAVSALETDVTNRPRFTILSADADDDRRRIAIRPRAGSGMTLRIWYFDLPLTPADDTDTLPFYQEHYELVAVGAARNLMLQGQEPTGGVDQRYFELWDLFKKGAARAYKGPRKTSRFDRGHIR